MATPLQVNIALGILNRYHDQEPECATARQTYLAAEHLVRTIITGNETVDAPPVPIEVPTQNPAGNALPPGVAALLGAGAPVPAGTTPDNPEDQYVVEGLSQEEMREVCKLLSTMRNQPPQ